MRTDLVFLTGDHPSFAGSRFLRARQLSRIARRGLEPLGVQASVSVSPDAVSNAVVVLNKSFLAVSAADQLSDLRARSNAVLADFVDMQPSPDLCQAVDGFLASSYRQERFLKTTYPDKPTFRVLHHADIRIRADCAAATTSGVGYFGQPYNGLHLERLAAESLCDFVYAGTVDHTGWMDRLADYAFHYAVRASQPFDGFKPFTKGAVAARCGAVILASSDEEEAVLQLGEEYPFLLASTAFEDVRDAVIRIRDSHGGPEWQAAQAAMLKVRQRSSPKRIARALGEAFAAFR